MEIRINPRFRPGEVAWITGASSGIGLAIAGRLAREGVHLVMSAREPERLEAAAQQIRKTTEVDVVTIRLDVAKPQEIAEAARKIGAEFGRLDIAAPAAGHELVLPFDAISPKLAADLFAVQVGGAAETVRRALPALRRSGARPDGQARVLFVSSVTALGRGWPGNSLYAASKGAQTTLMRNLAVELAGAGIRVNAVGPGIVRTPMQERVFSRIAEEHQEKLARAHPLGLGEVEDVAEAAAFLLSYEARWITGAQLAVDGGALVA